MRRALIGHTGFVGGNLLRQTTFDKLYRSRNVDELRGECFDLVVCAGAPAVKWKANAEPEADLANLRRLTDALGEASAAHVVLISTVDVYAEPVGVDEDTPIDPSAATSYGRHRRMLEAFVEARFACTVLRLPGLFGPGLKKNVVYDFLHANRLEAIAPDAVFQFYDLARLWHDVERVRAAGLRLVNLATEPTSVRRVAREAFGMEFENPDAPGGAARYDMRTRHDRLLGGERGYLYDAATVLADMRAFVEAAGWKRP